MIPQTPHIAMSAKKENDGMGLCLRERIRHSIFLCLALVTMFSMFLLTTVNVQANTVTINDQAGVLDAGRVQAEAAQLSAPILIFTTNTFNGDQDALNTYTREMLPNQDAIAIGIDTVHRNLSIEAGTNVSLSDSDASYAVSLFQNNYDNVGDYTSATIVALDSVQNALSVGGMNPSLLAVAALAIPLGTVVFFVVVYAILRRTGIEWIKWGGSYYSGGGGGHGGGHGGGGAGGHFGGHGGGGHGGGGHG